jgi:hypothetical protein
MAADALDPGPNGDYPYFPRLPDGSPAWADTVPAGYSGTVILRCESWVTLSDGRRIGVDETPRDAEGNPINPPVIPPA